MANAKSPRRPIRGLRLTYELDFDGGKVLVRMKESIGRWLELKPVPPRTGVFGASGLPAIPGIGGSNIGRRFLRQPAGFRFQSYEFLVKPGTKIAEPVANCAEGKIEERLIYSFSIGFGRGPKEARVTRWRVQKWIDSTKRKDDVIGFITPSGVKHIWKESMNRNPARERCDFVRSGFNSQLNCLILNKNTFWLFLIVKIHSQLSIKQRV